MRLLLETAFVKSISKNLILSGLIAKYSFPPNMEFIIITIVQNYTYKHCTYEL